MSPGLINTVNQYHSQDNECIMIEDMNALLQISMDILESIGKIDSMFKRKRKTR